MCSADNVPNLDAFQILQLLGLLKRDDYNFSIVSSIASDIVIVIMVIIMRSMLKKSGLWKSSLNYSVLLRVHVIWIIEFRFNIPKRQIQRMSLLLKRLLLNEFVPTLLILGIVRF